MKIAIATENAVKREAVERAVARAGVEGAEIRTVAPPPGRPEQPIDGEVAEGALSRARFALATTEADLGVGIETGLLRLPGTDRRLNVPICAIADRTGRVTFGLGPGFELPGSLERLVLAGRPLRRAADDLLGDEGDGGVVSILSGGRIDRRALTEAAVATALLARTSTAALGPVDGEGR